MEAVDSVILIILRDNRFSMEFIVKVCGRVLLGNPLRTLCQKSAPIIPAIEVAAKLLFQVAFARHQATDACTEIPGENRVIYPMPCPEGHMMLLMELIFGYLQCAFCWSIGGNDELTACEVSITNHTTGASKPQCAKSAIDGNPVCHDRLSFTSWGDPIANLSHRNTIRVPDWPR